MDFIILVIAAAVILISIFAVKLFYGGNKDPKGAVQRQRPLPVRRRDGAPRRIQLRNRGPHTRENVEDVDAEDEDENIQNDKKIELHDGKIGAKKRAKLEAKAEKKAHREAEEHLREEKKNREQIAELERKKQEEIEQTNIKKKLEEEQKAREEKERREHEEYLKMKESFLVEEEGFEEGEISEQNQLQEFVDYIKQNKVVVIEDLAAYFKLKTQTAIDRIKDLQMDNILTGVIDDRGKFIYINVEEMEAVSKFIKQRGRITISELVEHSSTLIKLLPQTPPHP